MPKFSVVIPTHNRARYVKNALDSVLAQTFKDYEIILVDDGSTDETKKSLEPYAKKIRYVYQRNQGPSAARNSGIALAKGEWITFLDSDDLWFPDTLESHEKYVKNHPDKAMVHGCLENIDENGNPLPAHTAVGQAWWMRANRGNASYENFIFECRAHLDTVAIRKSCLETVGFFDPDIRVCEDLDFFLRVAARFKIGFLSKSLALFRVHNNGSGVEGFNQGHLQVLRKHLNLVESNFLPVDVTRAKRNLRLCLSRKHFIMNQPFLGRKYFLKAASEDLSAFLIPSYLRGYLASFLPTKFKAVLRSSLRILERTKAAA